MTDVALSKVLAGLRHELTLTRAAGLKEPLKFAIDEVEVELQFSVTSEATAGAGVAFWVFNAKAEGKAADAATQRIKLKMKITDAAGGSVPMGSEEQQRK